MKTFILRDRLGRFGKIVSPGLPHRILESVAGALCVEDNKVLKERHKGFSAWPLPDGLPMLTVMKQGHFVTGVRGDNFEAAIAGTVQTSEGFHGNQYTSKLN